MDVTAARSVGVDFCSRDMARVSQPRDESAVFRNICEKIAFVADDTMRRVYIWNVVAVK